MNYDVIQAEYIEEYRLNLSFADGKSGVVDFKSFIEKGGVFKILEAVELFKQFSVDPDWNTITWKNGDLDVAPETLYYEATGGWPIREQFLNVAEMSPDYPSK
jgi:hypothetical protein